MKNKGVFSMLMNPFTRIAGWQAFGIGMIGIILMGIMGSMNGTAFDGVLDMHMKEITLIQSFEYLLISLACLVLVMWITGLIISKKFRFIDILGTMTLAKFPYIILAIAGFFAEIPDMSNVMSDPYSVFMNIPFDILLALSLPVTIWNIILIYNAFRVSCDVSGSKLTIGLIIGLLIAEALSKVITFFLV
jgi:hypothetical protein